jgi:hypothetical protein
MENCSTRNSYVCQRSVKELQYKNTILKITGYVYLSIISFDKFILSISGIFGRCEIYFNKSFSCVNKSLWLHDCILFFSWTFLVSYSVFSTSKAFCSSNRKSGFQRFLKFWYLKIPSNFFGIFIASESIFVWNFSSSLWRSCFWKRRKISQSYFENFDEMKKFHLTFPLNTREIHWAQIKHIFI